MRYGTRTFDKSRSPDQALSFAYAENYFKNSGVSFDEPNKRTLGLLDADGYYTNAALLLSDQCEYSIKCAVFEGLGKTKLTDRKAFLGSILKQMYDAYEYIVLSNNLYSSLNESGIPDYPPLALREVLINTIVHRNYDYSGDTLVNIFDDRTEFVSIGGLVKGVTIPDIIRGVSLTRNTALANLFYCLRLTESHGAGIQRILESYANSKVQPSFFSTQVSFIVTLPNINKASSGSYNKTLSNEENVLKFLTDNGSITRKDIEQLLSCSQFPAIQIINRLLEQGSITKTGSARATKYILTK